MRDVCGRICFGSRSEKEFLGGKFAGEVASTLFGSLNYGWRCFVRRVVIAHFQDVGSRRQRLRAIFHHAEDREKLFSESSVLLLQLFELGLRGQDALVSFLYRMYNAADVFLRGSFVEIALFSSCKDPVSIALEKVNSGCIAHIKVYSGQDLAVCLA